ncbi:MAG: DUF1905 domain-containing protein, partial [Thermoplasmata archaeon]
GINPYVDVPKEVSDAFGIRGNIRVKGTVNGFPFSSTLVPIGGGHHRLYVNTAMREGARVGVGDMVTVVVEYDPIPREYPAPDVLMDALREANLEQEFEQLPRSRRKDIVLYLDSLKTPESIKKNVQKVIELLKTMQIDLKSEG